MQDRRPKTVLKREFQKKLVSGGKYGRVSSVLDKLEINTICQSARCPNRGECFSRGTATFLIMGPKCTRGCLYCSVEKGIPDDLDREEPEKVARAVKELNLSYTVITSTTRDDLSDGGLSHFVETVIAVRRAKPDTSIEVLVPDFGGNFDKIEEIFKAGISVFNHNIEVVKRLFPEMRPRGSYERSLELLKLASELCKKYGAYTKSGFMVGLGETFKEIMETLKDLKEVNVDIVTVGQYFPPTRSHVSMKKLYTKSEYDAIEEFAKEIGIRYIAAGPYIRSSFGAEEANSMLRRSSSNA
jgi:lipoic acid synthetase